MDLTSVPQWVATALLGAAIAALGFACKQILEWLGSVRAANRARRARLVTLLSLLRGTKAVFSAQAALRNRLADSLSQRDPKLAEIKDGYESMFSTAFATFTDKERELHKVIRGYTVGGLRPLNEAIVEWLRTDTEFKLAVDLGRPLAALEAHLLMWLAKYAAWIPDAPQHALVYLGDEEGHGVPFPTGIETVIENTLGLTSEAL
jgi:hypothetical protein